jgi:DNA-binding NtrC family response regulator
VKDAEGACPAGAEAWSEDAPPSRPREDGAAFSNGVIPLHEMERIMIKKGLEHTSGNRTQAAELLGISVRTLRNKLNEYREAGVDIERP